MRMSISPCRLSKSFGLSPLRSTVLMATWSLVSCKNNTRRVSGALGLRPGGLVRCGSLDRRWQTSPCRSRWRRHRARCRPLPAPSLSLSMSSECGGAKAARLRVEGCDGVAVAVAAAVCPRVFIADFTGDWATGLVGVLVADLVDIFEGDLFSDLEVEARELWSVARI